MNCPNCDTVCHRGSANTGIGMMYGPYGCPNCGWSEWSEYDLSKPDSNPVTVDGIINQYGELTPVKVKSVV